MLEEKVNFLSEGVKLFGLFARPRKNQRNKYPCVILAHGYINSKDEFGGFRELAEALVESQRCVLRFDFRGCGDSGGEYGRMLCATDWPLDLKNALSYALTRPEVDGHRIALIGQSMGGSTVSYLGAFDDRVKTIISMAAVADGRNWLEQLWVRQRGHVAWKEFLQEIRVDQKNRVLQGISKCIHSADALARDEAAKHQMELWAAEFPYYQMEVPLESVESLMACRPVDVAHRISCPIMFMHGLVDNLVPPVNCDLLYENSRGKKSRELIEDAGHDLPIGNKKEHVKSLIMAWLDEYL
jgi:hypothetical protein